MHELGNVQHAAQGTRALTTGWNESPNPAHETAKLKIAYDDAAAAVIRDQWQTQDIQQDNQDADAIFSASGPTETESQAKANQTNSVNPALVVYSDPGKLRLNVADEIRAINSFDGFLLGVHDKIEKFPKNSEFVLKQVLDVEKRMAKDHETLELYKFTLRRIRQEALKALRCQGNLGPQRALLLLRETVAQNIITKRGADVQTVVNPEQKIV